MEFSLVRVQGLLCGFAAFKQHCAFGFWKGSLILDKTSSKSYEAMGNFGRITSCRDLPTRKTLIGYVKEARRLNDEGVKVSRLRTPSTKKELPIPAFFMSAVKKNKKALATFESFPYSKQKDYVEWVTEAKRDETRERRIKASVEWLAEGKSRNWKYENC